MGWSLLGVVLIELAVDVLNTVGWRLTFALEEAPHTVRLAFS